MTPPPAVEHGARVLPFRRRQGAVRVRRRSLLVELGRLLGQATLLLGLPLGVLGWVLAAPAFALAEIRVEGLHFLSAAWVSEALAPLRGENLPRLALGEVTARLTASRWIEQVTVEKRLPRTLVVRVRERQPAALWRRGSDLVFLDTQGVAIGPYEPGRGADGLLLVSTVAGAESELPTVFALAAELTAAAPDWAAQLSEIELLSDGDFRIHSGAVDFPVVLRQGAVAAQIAPLRQLLPEIARRYERLVSVDCRFPRRLILLPAAAEPRTAAAVHERSDSWPSPSST